MVAELLLPLGNGQKARNGRRLWDRRHFEGEPIMMESIKSFFLSNMAEKPKEEAETEPADLRLAACALLLELAYADDDFSEQERSHLGYAIQRQFGLDLDQAAQLVTLAEEQRSQSRDLWSFPNLIV